MHTPTQDDIRIIMQSTRNVFCYVDILNENFKKIGTLDGQVITDTYSFDANSDIRKTMSLTLHVSDSSLLIGRDKKIWFDKYLDVYFGIQNNRTGEIVRYPIGLFLFYDVGYQYDAASRTLTLSLVDRVADLNGDRRGELAGTGTIIPAESDMRDSIVKTVTQLGGIATYRVDDIGKKVPYDLEFGQGARVWQILTQLRGLYLGWEMFFDRDTFIYQAYPTTTSAPVVIDDTILKPLVISENQTNQMNVIRNVVEVWGKCLDAEHYTETVTGTADAITATYVSVAELSNGDTFGFKAVSDNTGSCTFQVNAFTAYPILGENNAELTAGQIAADKSYVLKYKSVGSKNYFYFQGEYQVAAIAKLVASEPTDEKKAEELANEPTDNIVYVVEPESPYVIEAIGEMRTNHHGGEYDNIYSEDLAVQRAKYDLWLATDMRDTITIECIEIPWLDVNQKVRYTSLSSGITSEYIITNKSGSTTGGTMNLTMVKFQPLYSWAE